MKKIVVCFAVMLFSVAAWSQENVFTVSGGYAFANPEEWDEDATGYRINGLYEFNPNQGKLVHGVSFGYMHTKASSEGLGNQTTTVKLNSFPIYYAPKYIIGSGKLNGFVKGAVGMHFSNYVLDGAVVDDGRTTDVGFYGGAGLGAIYNVNEKMFLNLEYEWAYLSNSWYEDGFMNTAQIGIGFRF